jgi:hypothetical protein
MMHDDSPRVKLQQVQFAPPGHEPDDALGIGGVERH